MNMHRNSVPYAIKWVEGARHAIRCKWCGRDARRNRKGLCSHCNEVRKDLEKIEKQATQACPGLVPQLWLERELTIAREKKDDCIYWGQHLRDILFGRVDAFTLERWFRLIASRIAKNGRIHSNIATPLAWTFTGEQRQILAYLFWEIFGAEASHNRRNRAEGRVDHKDRMRRKG